MIGVYITYIQLCVFRSSVRSANSSNATLVLVCALFALTTFIMFQLSPDLTDPVDYYGRTLVIFIAFNVLMFVSLAYRKNPSRYRKVLSTFVGTRTLIDLCMILIVVLFPTNEEVQQVLTAAITLWRMCIVGYILKDALDVSLPSGILISIGFTILSIAIANLSMGVPSSPEAIPSND